MAIRERKSFVKQFLTVFIPLLAVLIVATSLTVMIATHKQKTFLLSNEESLVDLVSHAVADDLKIISSDLFYLANLPQFRSYLDSNSSPPADLIESFQLFSAQRRVYDQIRYLDATGMEVIRVNFDGSSASVVSEADLQSKANRYYFADVLRLEEGGLFVSPFDLNVENGSVEIPHKPVIRFGTPVFDSAGTKRGIVLINYLGNELLSRIVRYNSRNRSSITLLNSDGYWLKGLQAEDEWGFMFPGQQNRTIYDRFSSIDDRFRRKEQGQILSDEGLFTFATISPSLGERQAVNGRGQLGDSGFTSGGAGGPQWKIVSYVWPEVVDVNLYRDSKLIIFVAMVVTLLLAIFARLAAKIVHQKEDAAALQYSIAYKDQLTGLPNRRLMEDRLQQSVALADRSQSKVVVVILDLDGFRVFNETVGHEEGDQLLQMIATRLTSGVRVPDTVARAAGDEFVVVFGEVAGATDADAIAEKIVLSIATPFIIDDEEMRITTSAGVAVYPDDAPTWERLITSAEKALSSAKAAGRGRYARYADLEE